MSRDLKEVQESKVEIKEDTERHLEYDRHNTLSSIYADVGTLVRDVAGSMTSEDIEKCSTQLTLIRLLEDLTFDEQKKLIKKMNILRIVQLRKELEFIQEMEKIIKFNKDQKQQLKSLETKIAEGEKFYKTELLEIKESAKQDQDKAIALNNEKKEEPVKKRKGILGFI